MATIKLTNDVLISSNSLLEAIDPANLLATGSVNNGNFDTINITQDCYVCLFTTKGSNTCKVFISDGVNEQEVARGNQSADNNICFIAKQGQKGKNAAWNLLAVWT